MFDTFYGKSIFSQWNFTLQTTRSYALLAERRRQVDTG